jgi:predicted RNA binding protein YcfA (HicA-like mRNA interferase family)
MPRLTPIHWKTLECIFLKAGFKLERQTDNHRVYVKEGINRPVIIPKYKEVGRDIITTIYALRIFPEMNILNY